MHKLRKAEYVSILGNHMPKLAKNEWTTSWREWIHNDAHESTEAALAVADDGPQYQNLKRP